MKTVGFIDYYLDEFHANNYVGWLDGLSGGELKATYAWAKIDSPKGGMTTEQWCEKYRVQRLGSIRDVVEKSDCLIVLSPDNPEMHEELCQLPLRSGKRVYVDKTFADGRAAALRIFKIAEESGTPCFSSSALRFAEEYRGLGKGEVRNVASWGPGPLDVYSIHQIEPIIGLMGPQAKRVQYIGTREWPALVIEFDGGRRANLSHHGWDCPFALSVDYADGTSKIAAVHSEYFLEFVRQMADFFLTGDVKVGHAETVAIISVREAALKAAQRPGEWIAVG